MSDIEQRQKVARAMQHQAILIMPALGWMLDAANEDPDLEGLKHQLLVAMEAVSAFEQDCRLVLGINTTTSRSDLCPVTH